jgi:hypothetical protein
MEKSFSQVNEAFEALKRKFQAGEISREDFIDGMKKLRIRDDEGRFWMIGAQTGKWYYFDGKDWIQSEPPSQAAGTAICVYCGFENKIEATSCARCGGTIGEEPTKCPDCGSPLSKPFLTCPKCGTVPGGEISEPASTPVPGIETAVPPKKEIPTYAQARAETPVPKPIEKTDVVPSAAPDLGGDMVIKAVQPASLFFFWGVFGLLAGIVAGAFVGATGALKPQLGFLPVSLLQLQGTLFGALLDAIAGGVLAFLAFGSIAFAFGFLANLILTMTGGVQFRTGRPAAAAVIGKKKKKPSKRLSLTADGGD